MAAQSAVVDTKTTQPSPAVPSSSDCKPASYAPKLGSRIQVLWRIEPSASDETKPTETVDRWWGATVQDCTRETAGDAVKPEHANMNIHVLLYDAYGEFAEEVSRVVFVSPSTLVDMSCIGDENDGYLDWKIEGTDTDIDNSSALLSLEAYIADQDAMVEEAGISSDADLQVLSQYPASVQLQMATGYRKFADSIKLMLSELAAKQPPGYVITEADVQSIFTKLQAKSDQGS